MHLGSSSSSRTLKTWTKWLLFKNIFLVDVIYLYMIIAIFMAITIKPSGVQSPPPQLSWPSNPDGKAVSSIMCDQRKNRNAPTTTGDCVHSHTYVEGSRHCFRYAATALTQLSNRQLLAVLNSQVPMSRLSQKLQS
jgi:hypothetical protein